MGTGRWQHLRKQVSFGATAGSACGSVSGVWRRDIELLSHVLFSPEVWFRESSGISFLFSGLRKDTGVAQWSMVA